ncbi:P-loop containing nucleoside triphosphate hydrolase protein [Lasiosphaeria hispida]|uniref:P-loop containing nucleoside triphosphate hydrolase protein n=1 Tax=Lasiosphaeria hispida TaxID=260671 RepID=A0AAJ0MDZ9_9PEZI|nr:P-loop containing nucleoside triphosphate hydrolase protein [Lasiosphaeria hispida]
MKTLAFRIRKLHVNTDTEKRLQKRQPSRVYVNEEALIELTGSKDGGWAVCIEKASSSPSEPPLRREATLWKAPERLDKTVTQMYDAFRDACGYRLGEHVKITTLGEGLLDADEVVMEEIAKEAAPGQEAPQPLAPMPAEDLPGWEIFLAGRLSLLEHVHAGLVFKNLFVRGLERSFIVASVNGRSTGNGRYSDRKTALRIVQPTDDADKDNAVAQGKLEVTGIRGLGLQIKKLNRLLRCFTADFPFGIKPPKPPIAIHGGHGTGKTMLLNSIASTGWGTVFRIQFKDKLSEIHDVFQRATLQQPSIIVIDEFERLIDKERNNRSAVILAISEALDAFEADYLTKGEAPNVVVIAACLDYTTDMPEELKKPGRFTSEIYLPLPDVDGRREILASLNLHVQPDLEENLLRQLSERTHAYNGSDLKRLVNEARIFGSIRVSETHLESLKIEDVTEETAAEKPATEETTREATTTEDTAPKDSTALSKPFPYYQPSDYEEALKTVRPSAMHDINLKPPPIRWDDIGGQDSVKTSLRRAVRLSTESADTLARYFERPPKGFLLYGPPGCSKTMAAQAMATESGLNFFAVKGAELLNMYVGESERAVRRLFQRAREVAPSMIFFDEIDSIAGQRHGFGGGGGGGGPSKGGSGGSTSHGGLNVLTTLLNEMDGFEALQGVVVLAATNRPQALDPALLRPGRFDEMIYVSPPDEAARRAIFQGVATKRKMHPDVDIAKLARDTDGYSGAEIKGICAVAGVAAYDRYIADVSGAEDEWVNDDGIIMEDLEKAIASQKRQITVEMIEGFEAWERRFRRH